MIVSDVMTRKVLSVAPDETVEHAANLMLRHGISGLFVVDAKGTLLAYVTEGDLLRRDEIGTERHRPWWLRVLVSPGKQALDFTRAHGTEGQRCHDAGGDLRRPRTPRWKRSSRSWRNSVSSASR
jgi:hypothetical protein